jgi:cell division protein FtsI/penicillin-binding protein 2
VALKTGTAGNKKLGLDAILTGFFPADKPEYAFAFRLERAGKAEWRGALFLKDFLTAFYHDNPRQQGVK